MLIKSLGGFGHEKAPDPIARNLALVTSIGLRTKPAKLATFYWHYPISTYQKMMRALHESDNELSVR